MAKGKYQEWIEPDGLTKLEAWARNGLTDEQISKNMGISTATLYNWKRDYKAILEALKRGKEVVDIHVENALLKRALGYETVEVISQLVKNQETGEEELKIVKEIRKGVPPDTTAQIFWLKNRMPSVWRDRMQVDNEKEFAKVDELIKAIDKRAKDE